jgi:hypothetical protein
MEQELTEPPPPDIRPFSRFIYSPNNNDCAIGSIKGSNNPQSISASTQRHGTSARSNIRNASYYICLAAIVLALLPVVTAADIDAHVDKYTSYASIPQAQIQKRFTPLLSSIAWLLNHANQLFQHVTSHDLAGQMHYHVQKRLTTTQKVEAGMIPVLVLLSGMFAGLTLG